MPSVSQTEGLIKSYQTYYMFPRLDKNLSKAELVGILLRKLRPVGEPPRLAVALPRWSATFGLTATMAAPMPKEPALVPPSEQDVAFVAALSGTALREVGREYNEHYKIIGNAKDARKAEKDAALEAKVRIEGNTATDKQPPYGIAAVAAPMAAPMPPPPPMPKAEKAAPSAPSAPAPKALEVVAPLDWEDANPLSGVEALNEEEQKAEEEAKRKAKYAARVAKREADEAAAAAAKIAENKAWNKARREEDAVRAAQAVKDRAAVMAGYRAAAEGGYKYERPASMSEDAAQLELNRLLDFAYHVYEASQQVTKAGDRYHGFDGMRNYDKDVRKVKERARELNFAPVREFARFTLGEDGAPSYLSPDEAKKYDVDKENLTIEWMEVLEQLTHETRAHYDKEHTAKILAELATVYA